MAKRFCAAWLCIALFSFVNGGNADVVGQTIEIIKPTADSIVQGDSIHVELEVHDADANPVEMSVGDHSVALTQDGNRWTTRIDNLSHGVHELFVQCGDSEASCVVTLAPVLVPQGKQHVWLCWCDGADLVLQKTLQSTLSAELTDDELSEKAAAVRERITHVIERAFLEFNLEIVEQFDANTCHVVIEFVGDDTGYYGVFEGAGDGSNPKVASVFIGTFHNSMRTKSLLERWSPMHPDDSPDERVIDLSEAIGRTAAHELGHVFNLVSMQHANRHNSPDSEFSFGVDRFESGRYIMDSAESGQPVFKFTRIGETSAEMRSAREPAVFNAFNHSYLSQFLPMP